MEEKNTGKYKRGGNIRDAINIRSRSRVSDKATEEQNSPGNDKVRNEMWKNSNQNIRKRLTEIMNRIWRGNEFPKGWSKGVVVPIFKRGDNEDPKNYRGITLMDSSYKIYASILAERLQRDIEEKEILPDNQAGFRKGRSTLDNIYILKHLIDQELTKDKGKVYVLFADLKAAFDLVDREQLWTIMTKKKVDNHIIKKVKEIYKETANVVRTEDQTSSTFWTKKGLRQGCPLSPTLFSIYMADLEETMEKWQTGGIRIGNKKIWTLSYADDMVLIAKKPEDLKDMISRFTRYLDRKKMILSPEKTKIIEFRKGGGKEKKETWHWKNQEIEQVKEFKYLGYIFQKSNGDSAHSAQRRQN